MTDPQKVPSLSQWQALYDDKAALLRSPEAHQFALNEFSQELLLQGVIDKAELADLLEQADAAYQWGVEEQLSRELNQTDATGKE